MLFKIIFGEFIEMVATPCDRPLKSNPFTTYRDPITGKWIVVIQNLPTSQESREKQQ
ncbi:MAG: hypothetical protein HC941_22330 [Microcoleus sp. SU_5_3]|nr:hypothetical protein [Microcoleus sp. SU_5_3]